MDEDAHSKQRLYSIISEGIINSNKNAAISIKNQLYDRINTLVSMKFWESKNRRLDILKLNFSIEEVVIAVMSSVFVFDKEMPIQPAINNLSKHMGYLEDFEAIQTAADILNCCNGICYSLIRGEKLHIKSWYSLRPEAKLAIENLTCMEPMQVEPLRWDNNYSGGYYTHKTPALLGGKKVYEGYLALDVLNILQSVETNHGYFVWRYDSRGRFYPTGYKHTLYGNDQKRAQILFAKGEHI